MVVVIHCPSPGPSTPLLTRAWHGTVSRETRTAANPHLVPSMHRHVDTSSGAGRRRPRRATVPPRAGGPRGGRPQVPSVCHARRVLTARPRRVIDGEGEPEFIDRSGPGGGKAMGVRTWIESWPVYRQLTRVGLKEHGFGDRLSRH